jgi:hypothetical protein
MAHLKAQATRRDPEGRLQWKVRVVKGLYERGYQREDILELFRFVDWLLVLPDKLKSEFEDTLRYYEEEKKMPYITSIERSGIEKGILQTAREAVLDNLEIRFEQISPSLIEKVNRIDDPSILRMLRRRAEKSKTRRHLTEFWMLEPEMAYADLDDDMALAEELAALTHIIATYNSRMGVFRQSGGGKHILPDPFPVGMGRRSFQCERERNRTSSSGQVFLMQPLHALYMFLKWRDEAGGKHCDPIFHTFAVPHTNQMLGNITVFDTQPHTFHHSQPTSCIRDLPPFAGRGMRYPLCFSKAYKSFS